MRAILVLAAIFGFGAVAVGAMAAHALGARLDEQALDWIDTATRYQMWHALAMLGAAALMAWRPGRSLLVAAYSWAAGTILFAGSLTILAFTGERAFGQIVPFGGVALLVGWGALAWYGVAALRR